MKLARPPLGSFSHALLAMTAVLVACQQSAPALDGRDTATASAGPNTTAASGTRCDGDARRTVEQLGLRMRRVSLLAPTEVAAREIAETYSDLAAPELLAAWRRTPANAPGRKTSNPWPARIEIDSMWPEGTECHVEGQVVLVTTSDTNTAVERRRITASVRDSSGWRVSHWETAAVDRAMSEPPGASGDTVGAIAVVRRYFALIARHKYDSAYALWADAGRASGQSLAEFAAGYRDTVEVRATIGRGVRVEGAAGSQYVAVPVVLDAVLRDGRRRHFEGTYTARRSMVDGASAAQRSWRIYTATMREE
jgi:hypothetical protein